MHTAPSLPAVLRMALVGERPACSPRLAEALKGPIDVAALVELAGDHRVAPWLAAVIASEPSLAGDERFAPVARAAAGETLRTLSLFGELRQVLRHLNERDVPVVVLKGPVLAQEHYPDPSLRPYGDIDLLIHESDLPAVTELLNGRGYGDKHADEQAERLHHCHGLFQRIFIHRETGRIVEVHCDHLQVGLEPVSMSEIWASAEPVSFGRESARALATDDLFVQLCVHLNRHGFTRLIWFKDLDLLVRSERLDWQRVRAQAEQQGALDTVAYTLWLLEGMLRTPLPPGARALTAAQGRWSRTVHRTLWPPRNVLGLVPQRKWRLRRVVQFAPETGLLRGGLPSLLLPGRRRDKIAVLLRASTRSLRP